MKVLVVGSGGREHALIWKIAQSSKVEKIFCATGNAGIAELAECVNLEVENITGLVNFAVDKKIDLTIVGPETPLSLGIVDEFEKYGLRIFGPGKNAAMLESSKVFAKNIMQKHGIPTAECRVFSDPYEAKEYIDKNNMPVVIKADGLAKGKGVVIARDKDTAINAINMIMVDKIFGPAGDKLILEECLQGQEATIMIFTDGKCICPMEPAQDYKPVFDDDKGPNTGGMGCYSPVPFVSREICSEVLDSILRPLINAMKAEGIKYKGVLYVGLMLTNNGPKVLEFNCRFGDPESQVVLPRMETDLVEVMEAIIEQKLDQTQITWDNRKAVCVVIASGGYHGDYENGKIITGLEEAKRINDIIIFHAGTSFSNSNLVTAGGRVLGVTALGEQFNITISKVYEAVERIKFQNMHFRRDVGKKSITVEEKISDG